MTLRSWTLASASCCCLTILAPGCSFVEDTLLEGLDHLTLPGVVDDAAGNLGRDVLVDEELPHQSRQVLPCMRFKHLKSNTNFF
jgi:hypothetical protein